MSKAFIITGTAPIPVVQTALAAAGVAPRFWIDGVGAGVDLPNPSLAAVIAAIPGVLNVATGFIPNIAALPIAAAAKAWLEAWNKLIDPAWQATRASRPARWGNVPFAPVGASPVPPPAQIMTLTGDVAVGLVIVNGPGTAAIDATDSLTIALSVLNGFDILYKNAPASAKLVFLVDPRHVTLAVNPAAVPAPVGGVPTPAQYEAGEAPWRDPALTQIGLPTGFNGVNQYRNNLVARAWPTGSPTKSVVMFVTKYSSAYFAYAGGGRLVVQLPNTSAAAGSDNIDRVFAHETCHLFNAPDEVEANFQFGATFGPLAVPNGNSTAANNPFQLLVLHTACLMAGETDDLCPWSKAHVGWPLSFVVPALPPFPFP